MVVKAQPCNYSPGLRQGKSASSCAMVVEQATSPLRFWRGQWLQGAGSPTLVLTDRTGWPKAHACDVVLRDYHQHPLCKHMIGDALRDCV